MSHGNQATFPRVADVIGFFPAGRVVEVARAVVTVFRDFGDRTNRKHARLKYVLAERGPAWFRAEVEARTGFTLEPARPFTFERQGDLFGWQRQNDGHWFLGLYVETGRIADKPAHQLKTALRSIIATHQPEIHLTPSQNLILAGISDDQMDAITQALAAHGIPVENQAAAVRRASMACVALPTCGLALAEAERAMPGLLPRLGPLDIAVHANPHPGNDMRNEIALAWSALKPGGVLVMDRIDCNGAFQYFAQSHANYQALIADAGTHDVGDVAQSQFAIVFKNWR